MAGWGVIPTIRIPDMTDALAFYRDTLGFTVERGGETDSNVALVRGAARLLLETPAGPYSEGYDAAIRERLGSRSPNALYLEAEDLDALAERLRAAGATIVDPLAAREWGQAELTVEDPAGNWLTFWRATPPG